MLALIGERPLLDGIHGRSADLHSPALAENRDGALEILRIGEHRDLNAAERPAAELDHGDTRVFRLDSAGFALLLEKTDGTLTLANLSLLYRHATLSRQLDLTVEELVTAIELTGLDPFRSSLRLACW